MHEHGTLSVVQVPTTPPGAPTPRDTFGARLSAGRGGAGRPPPPKALRTRHVLFIFSGAFTELEASLRAERTAAAAAAAAARGTSGGAADLGEFGPDDADPLLRARTEDFVRHGLEPEFIGRVPVRVACRALGVDDLARVLRDPADSVLRQTESAFEGYGIQLSVSECAAAEVARRAAEHGTGARGLLAVLEAALRDFKFELPGTGAKRLDVTAETIRDPAAQLRRLLGDR